MPGIVCGIEELIAAAHEGRQAFPIGIDVRARVTRCQEVRERDGFVWYDRDPRQVRQREPE